MHSNSPQSLPSERTELDYRGVRIASLTSPMLEALKQHPQGQLDLVIKESDRRVELPPLNLNDMLDQLHRVLIDAQLAPPPGIERVDVFHPLTQERLGHVDRQLARLLGMEMHSAHLLAVSSKGLCLQRRALSKAVDPGKWDTTVGGTRMASESVDQTLVREMSEEAGLKPAQLKDICLLGMWIFEKESHLGGYAAWQYEKVWVWVASIEDQTWVPNCADGEVMEFAWFALDDLQRTIREISITDELEVLIESPDLRGYLARRESS